LLTTVQFVTIHYIISSFQQQKRAKKAVLYYSANEFIIRRWCCSWEIRDIQSVPTLHTVMMESCGNGTIGCLCSSFSERCGRDRMLYHLRDL